MSYPHTTPYQPQAHYMAPTPPHGYCQPEYQSWNVPIPSQGPPAWHAQHPPYPNQHVPHAHSSLPSGAYSSVPRPPQVSPPLPMLISGNTVTNLTTGQPIYTITTNSSKTKITLVHNPTGITIGQGERHTFSSNTVTISNTGLTAKLKKQEGSISDRWAYIPTWEQGGVKWYFKNRTKLDFRLMDEKSGGREVLTCVKKEIKFERFLSPEQVGELLLALAVLREQVKEDKEIGEEVASSVLESVLLG